MLGKICIIGDGLSSLILAKALCDLNIHIDVIRRKIINKKNYQNRSLALSNSNLEFLLNLGVLKKKRDSIWKINEIKLYDNKLHNLNNLIFNFKKKDSLFCMVENNKILYELMNDLKKNKLIKQIQPKNYNRLIKKITYNKNYDLIINCDNSNFISKKFFSKKIKKIYNAISFTSIIQHQKIKNNIAYQYFTEKGPLAFLPLSNYSTSIVWTINSKLSKNFSEISRLQFKNKIRELFEIKARIKSFSQIAGYSLNFLVPRNYVKNNILIFGDNLHKIHPFVGQGLNMTIRDIKLLREIIKKRISLGLYLDTNILLEFTKKTKPFNYIFANGIDITEKYFSINNKFLNKYSNILLSKMNKNPTINNIIINLADKGLRL